jgi:hypothetical protein
MAGQSHMAVRGPDGMVEPQRRQDAKVKSFNAENAEKAQRTLRKQ